eukprot:5291089-Pleurochrysis_carterae.AAC.1
MPSTVQKVVRGRCEMFTFHKKLQKVKYHSETNLARLCISNLIVGAPVGLMSASENVPKFYLICVV